MKAKKIFILGTSGSGKTTLAEKISKNLKIKSYDLDDIFWKRKYDKKRDYKERKNMLEDLIKNKKEWIIEGIFTDFSKKAIDKADLIILIHPGKTTRIVRLALRYIKRKFIIEKKKKESLKDALNLIKYSMKYEKSKKHSGFPKHKRIIENNSKGSIFLKNNRQINEFLEKFV